MAQQTFKLDDKNLQKILKNVAKDVEGRIIHDGVDYGIWQEFGEGQGGNPRPSGRGVTGPGHPSLGPAFERVTRDLPQALGEAIEAGISLQDIIDKAAFDIQALWQDDVNVDTGTYKNSIEVSPLE